MAGNPLFKNSEWQKEQRAKVKRESLVKAGKAGYQATCRAGKQHIASQKAAKWRLEHPTNLECAIISQLELLGINYRREVEINGFYADFVINHYVIEVNGQQWHELEQLRPGQKERDGHKYRTLADAGYTMIVLPEQDIKSGKAQEVLSKLFSKGGDVLPDF